MSCGLLRSVSCYVPDCLTSVYPGVTTVGIVPDGGLAADPESFERPSRAEVLHAPWAMWGTLEGQTLELLPKDAVMDYGASKGEWFNAVHARSILAVLVYRVFLMGAVVEQVSVMRIGWMIVLPSVLLRASTQRGQGQDHQRE